MSRSKVSNITQERLHQLYNIEKLSYAEIAAQEHVCVVTIKNRMKEYGFTGRSRSERLKLALSKKPQKRGAANPNWRGGIRTANGYIAEYAPEHPRATNDRYVYQHTLVWERTHGKLLPMGWVVHHLNGLKTDNRPENLVAIPRQNHHIYLFLQSVQRRLREVEGALKRLKEQGRLL